MAKSDSQMASPRVRRWLSLFYAAPLLSVIGIYGYLYYAHAHHLRPSEPPMPAVPFQAQKLGDLIVSLFTPGDQLRPSGNDLFLEFRDAQDHLTNVGNVSLELSLDMNGMVMHSIGKVRPTSMPGRYHTSVEPQIGGEWSAHLAFTNAAGAAETTFPVNVK